MPAMSRITHRQTGNFPLLDTAAPAFPEGVRITRRIHPCLAYVPIAAISPPSAGA